MFIEFLLGIWVLAALESSSQPMTFTTCPFDVESYFEDLFPEYNPTRRRRQLEEEKETLESEIFKRNKRKNTPFTTRTRATEGILNRTEEDTLRPNRPIAPPSYIPERFSVPSNTWDLVRMAASGCTSCSSGCCDAVDISLTCARKSVPLNYNLPANRNISLMTYRVRLTNTNLFSGTRKHLWMLQGGPGGSGLSILFLAVHALQFATDVYIPDHRGTGLSATLSCPLVAGDGEDIPYSQVSSCFSNAKEQTSGGSFISVDPRLYTVSNAARDLHRLISEQNLVGPVFLHGYSYGTRWASRFLQLFPTSGVVEKVVLEGNVAKSTVFNDFALGSQAAGTRFMQKCALDSECASFFTSSISIKISQLAAEGTTNPCTSLMTGSGAVVTSALIRELIQSLLFEGLSYGLDGPYSVLDANGEQISVFVDFRAMFLALISRWFTCLGNKPNYRVFAAGIAWYLSLSGGYAQLAAISQDEEFNRVVVASELRRYPMESQSTFNANRDSSEWGVYNSYTTEKGTSDAWEVYKSDSDMYFGNAPVNVNASILIVNGEIDGNTYVYDAVRNFDDITVLSGKTKRLAIIPEQGHHASGFGCGETVVKDFYVNNPASNCGEYTVETDPTQPLSTSFTLAPQLSQVLIGGPSSLFSGNVASSYCFSPPVGASSGAVLAYCAKCLDYCVFLNFVGERVACPCAQDLGACLKRGGVSNAQSTCSSYLNQYGTALGFSQFKTSGSCSQSCSDGAAGNGVFGNTPSPSSPSFGTTTSVGGGWLSLFFVMVVLFSSI